MLYLLYHPALTTIRQPQEVGVFEVLEEMRGFIHLCPSLSLHKRILSISGEGRWEVRNSSFHCEMF